ncbi:MAG: hypothetical protein WDN04_02640 [Rhodospirillales bacterium]
MARMGVWYCHARPVPRGIGREARAIAFANRQRPPPTGVGRQGTINKSFCFFFQKEALFLVLFEKNNQRTFVNLAFVWREVGQ